MCWFCCNSAKHCCCFIRRREASGMGRTWKLSVPSNAAPAGFLMFDQSVQYQFCVWNVTGSDGNKQNRHSGPSFAEAWQNWPQDWVPQSKWRFKIWHLEDPQPQDEPDAWHWPEKGCWQDAGKHFWMAHIAITLLFMSCASMCSPTIDDVRSSCICPASSMLWVCLLSVWMAKLIYAATSTMNLYHVDWSCRCSWAV